MVYLSLILNKSNDPAKNHDYGKGGDRLRVILRIEGDIGENCMHLQDSQNLSFFSTNKY